MESIRDFICYNQKQIIKFEYVISNLHKDFKNIFYSEASKEETTEAYDKLHVDSFILMEKIFQDNMQFINNTLGLMDKDLRFTIKIINNEHVTDIFRNHEINTLFYESKYSDNSAFSEIMDNEKKYFYCDDLHQLFLENKYKNPRLKSNTRELLEVEKKKWKDCWTNYDQSFEEKTSYYNSSLVIPMSITSENENINEDFYKAFFEQNSDSSISSKTRSIWGFVCFDSKETNYFKNLEYIDFLDLSFIISDILSIYLVYFYNYTTTSKTIIEYEKSLETQ